MRSKLSTELGPVKSGPQLLEAPQGSDAAPGRVMVFQRAGGQRIPLARVRLVTNFESPDHLELRSDSPEAIERIKGAIDESKQAALNAEVADWDLRSHRWKTFVQALELRGFGVENIPAGDQEIKIQLDIPTGRILGVANSLHDFAVQDEPLARRVLRSVAGALRRLPDELAEKIEILLARGERSLVVAEVRRAVEQGALEFPPTTRLLTSIMSIDTSVLDASDRRMIHQASLAVALALGRYDVAGSNAEALLRDHESEDDKRAALEMLIALAAMKNGRTETALLMWHKLLEPPDKLGALGRGWAWRNLSLALPLDNAKTRHAARCSADAFLEAGEKLEAGRSLKRLVDSLMPEFPTRAIQVVDEMIGLTENIGPLSRGIRAAAFQIRANRYARVAKHDAALADAQTAVELRRGLVGAEEELISSLHLAAAEAKALGQTEAANTYLSDAEKLTRDVGSSHFGLAQRTTDLFEIFDRDKARETLREAEAVGDIDVVAAVRVLEATRDPALTDIARLSILEDTLRQLDNAGAPKDAKVPASLALADQLLKSGQPERAETLYREILKIDPFSNAARSAFINCLWKHEKWADAGIFLKKQIEMLGPMPGLLYAYGRSLFGGADFSGALAALTQAMDNSGDNKEIHQAALELREAAIRSGGTVSPTIQRTSTAEVTLEEFDRTLEQFRNHISTSQRMGFWRKKNGADHSWIERPEKYAQSILHPFLVGRLLDRVSIFEELPSGAGRLDIYVKLFGGLSLILELKMCGYHYSSSYAAAGETQILHYMANRRSHLGYLVVFDARVRDFGRPLLASVDHNTVVTKFVDVRPRVSKR